MSATSSFKHVRRVGDDDAVLARPFHVDGIVADPEIGDDLELGQLFHQRAVHREVAGGRDGANAGGDFGDQCIAVLGLGEPVHREKLVRLFLDQRHHRAGEDQVGLRGRGHEFRSSSCDSSVCSAAAATRVNEPGARRERLEVRLRTARPAPRLRRFYRERAACRRSASGRK